MVPEVRAVAPLNTSGQNVQKLMLHTRAKAERGFLVEYNDEVHELRPHMFYEMIERMFPDLPKLELFARDARSGWVSWAISTRSLEIASRSQKRPWNMYDCWSNQSRIVTAGFVRMG